MIGFTGVALVRADNERDDPAAFARCLADPAARLLVLTGLEPPVAEDGALQLAAMDPARRDALLLGYLEGAPLFVAGEGDGSAPAMRSPALMAALAEMPAADVALYGIARSLVDWHSRHGFCARCGHASVVARGGWARSCPGCGALHFPRTDPVVIMAVEHDDRVLLGRQPSWPAGRYSALAGFVEVGESIEEAVAREVLEEAGVAVAGVRYVASQPWPFPSQLMIACIATAADDALRIDATELEDAFWATRDEVRAALAGDTTRFIAPPGHAIARSLLMAWVVG
ncbi:MULTISPECIES: NAD(+) diphosphatase [Sphingomonas]|jgi:NAD+ diphosphatase|uniref:NAD(+) diphosphatase n=1 Tax=Sphingomonas hankookensis TaxID=563996 RepID=A0ABR5YCG8_9SPHN|nr:MULTISPECIES: NAD(+) diphosphatase [Sphingomonas]KZE15001.1 NADH pyrophosphatase [Sphingomonas hankookensis]PZT94522.1 MAG: NAD(+) diphosphatase [Sphingomonas sp.]RSV25564.1 NAD(+) diphosphatase [Sphingomonas sp. ABOLH]WCP72550.1 NAD(+) diphosphatase [Sphingomonas hankookensis]